MKNIRNILIGLLLPVLGVAQRADIHFHHFREEDGISNSFVTRFLRDSRGILWLGTQNGLNRFDGSHFFPFTRSRDTQSIIDNVILDLCEDQKGRIWGATSNGIFCYTVETGQFRNYKTPSTRFAKVIKNIYCDKSGNIWATGEWNIMLFNEQNDSFSDIPPLSISPDSANAFAVLRNGILEDPQGKGIWFATRQGLHLYNPVTKHYTDYRTDPGNPLLTDHFYSAFHQAWDGKIWVYDRTERTLLCMDKKMQTISSRILLPESLSNLYVSCVFVDRNHRIWFSTWDKGIYILNPGQQNSITQLKHEVDNPLSVAGDFMWDVMQDADGTIWLGTSGGLSLTNPEKSLFTLYHFGAGYPELKHREMNVVVPDPDGTGWWIAFSGDQFGLYNPLNGNLTLFDFKKLPVPEPLKTGFGIHNFRFCNDSVFVTGRKAVLVYTKHNHKWTVFDPLQGRLPGFYIRDAIRYNDSIWYLNSFYSFCRWNKNSNSVREILPAMDTLGNGQKPVFDKLRLDKKGRIWFVSGFGWIGYMDAAEQIRYFRLQDKSALDYNGYYTALSFDEKGRLWLANHGAGLDCFDPETKTTTSYFQSDGLYNDEMTGVITDRKGRVWASANNRFSVFHPGSGKYYNFRIPLNEGFYNYGTSGAETPGGSLVLTLYDHLVEFHPDKTDNWPEKPLPEISAVQVNGRTLFINGGSVIRLEPKENNLRILFGMQNDRQVFPYRFRYRLKGADNDWKLAGNNAEAVYSNLQPGTYTFYLRAESESDNRESPEITLRVIIRTPFFQTRLFYFLVLLLFFVLFYLLYRYRIRQKEQLLQLENKAQRLEKEKAQVMYENLKQHLNPHFLFNSLTSLGSLIRLNPGQALVFLDKMSKVYRYVLRNRDNETVPLEEELKFVQLYNDLQRTRFESALQIYVNIPEELYHRKIPPVTLQNLVENAIKHNTADVEMPLVIEIFVADDYLVVRNNLQVKNFVETSNKQGLHNMDSLFRFLSDRPMLIEKDDHYFIVKIPLL